MIIVINSFFSISQQQQQLVSAYVLPAINVINCPNMSYFVDVKSECICDVPVTNITFRPGSVYRTLYTSKPSIMVSKHV